MMQSLWITLPVTLLLAATLVALVVRAARRGDYEDWEGPAARLFHDDDTLPEREGAAPAEVEEVETPDGAEGAEAPPERPSGLPRATPAR